jgi:hypothetical protein
MAPFVWRVLADITVTIHVAYVAFVVLGQMLIVIGTPARWTWVRNPVFRAIHLGMIGIVVVEAWIGMTCPLTLWEQAFRRRAGQATYTGDFVARWLHDLLFFDLPPATFTTIYSIFGLLVLGTIWLAPPRWRATTEVTTTHNSAENPLPPLRDFDK